MAELYLFSGPVHYERKIEIFLRKKNIEALRDTESKKLVNASRQKKKQFKVLPPLFPNL